MIAVALPFWRRSVARRLICVGLAVLPALVLQASRLDPDLSGRWLVLGLVALPVALLLRLFTPRRRPRHRVGAVLLDGAIQAALVAALWPATLVVWPAALALTLALIAQHLLGGGSVNPFHPTVLALAVAMALGHLLTTTDFAPALVLLADAWLVAAVWIGMAAVLAILGVWPLRAPIAFLSAVVPALAMGGISATAFVVAALVAGFVLADTRYLPATPKGQYVTGALAGLGTAMLWLMGAPPGSFAHPLLLVYALVPWIEARSLPRLTARRPPA